MPDYLIKAVSRRGETLETLRSAPDEAALMRQLQEEDLLPLKVVPAEKASWLGLWRHGGRRLRQKEVLAFTRELATLLGAGLPLDRSLKVLLELFPDDSALHQISARILEKVKGGAQLSAALEAEGKAFSRLYINMVRAGEAGGTLAQVLRRLADYLQRSQELRASVISALIYPAILVVMAAASLLVLLTFVVPQFEEMFASAGKELPLPTQIVMAAADGVRRYGWLASIGILVAIRGFQHWLADPERHYRFHRWLLRLPLLGSLLIRVEVARFSQTLATLLTSGVALLPALEIVRETLSNRVLREAVSEAAEKLRAGGDISTALEETGHFPVMALQMIRMGEETGQLPQMLTRMADIYEDEVRTAIQRLLTLLEPVLIVGLGVVIAAIIVSILMAVVSVNELAF
ncbi:general secretion pathway protein F [Methylomarinovum tepidoasis]|uniref:General secretion pathway protein F n=1 Tax=Methylomarinovum tepidoasis TaxID=2840183 RepID=A0AAU9CC90_9GAMM|nr:type II secretion system F family protein [Methylomarinovum sp. IN45]BCX89546.1 general secretion pathway protein F [Methylomarinovum sp. IN45]